MPQIHTRGPKYRRDILVLDQSHSLESNWSGGIRIVKGRMSKDVKIERKVSVKKMKGA